MSWETFFIEKMRSYLQRHIEINFFVNLQSIVLLTKRVLIIKKYF
jgi:hypothetical protein